MAYEYSDYFKIEQNGSVLTVTFNDPANLNALGGQPGEFERLFDEIAMDQSVNAVILTGAGRAFMAGGNIKKMAANPDAPILGPRVRPAGGTRLLRNMLDVQQPIIAAVNGDAMGLGATVALMSDIVIAADAARFGDTHVSRVGVVAGDGGAVIWPLLTTINRAKEYLMLGKVVTAAEAERLGLVNHVVPRDEVLPRAQELAEQLAEGPTWAIRWTKASVQKVLRQRVDMILEMSLAYEGMTFSYADHREAIQSFVEKRRPVFQGR